MPIIQWTEDMSVGVDSLDSDHKMLISMINQLDDAIRGGKEPEVVGAVLSALLDYTGFHFEREEALMAACGYPDLDAHQRTHEALRAQVAAIHERFIVNTESIGQRDVLAFLKNWLTAHIMGRDKVYAPFMASRAEAVAAADRAFGERAKDDTRVPQDIGSAAATA